MRKVKTYEFDMEPIFPGAGCLTISAKNMVEAVSMVRGKTNLPTSKNPYEKSVQVKEIGHKTAT